MGVSVDGLSSKNNRALRQAEGGPTARVEPIRDVLDSVLLFDLHVAGVGPGQVRGGDPGNVVAIQEEWHSYLNNAYGPNARCGYYRGRALPTSGIGLARTLRQGVDSIGWQALPRSLFRNKSNSSRRGFAPSSRRRAGPSRPRGPAPRRS